MINHYHIRALCKAFGIVALMKFNVCIGQETAPSTYPATVNVNSIRTWEATAPESNPSVLITRPLRNVKQTTQYLDGLGRPVQTVLKMGSLQTGRTPNDFVSAITYDELGRERLKYLPFASNNANGNNSINDGQFKMNPFQQEGSFSSAQYPGETFFYSQQVYESSPLNRIKKTLAPGNNWVGSNRGIESKYWFNTATDIVRKWIVTDGITSALATYSSPGIYAAGKLYKNVTVDEHLKQVIEFKDNEGKIVLKKVQITATPDNGSGSSHTGWLCTYYIYDYLNNLRCVIQPKGVELIASTWALADATILAEQCFRYEYDERNRMVVKKVPGAGEIWIVYDRRDRIIMTQDANLRAQTKWMVILYDNFDRPAETGLYTNSGTRITHAASAFNSFTYPFTLAATPATGYEKLTKTGYDTYNTLPAGTGLTTTFDNSYATHFSSTYNTSPDFAQALTASSLTKGMVAWTETKVLGTTTYLYAVNIYDDKGRAIQVKGTNITSGQDIITTQYNWAWQSLVSVIKNEKAIINPQTSIVVTKMSYDDLGRVTKIEKKISNTKVNAGSMPSGWKTIVQNEYDAMGQLKKKKLGAAPVDSLTFEYNIRGWMLGMNRSYVKDTTSAANWFGFELGYDKTNFTVNSSSKSYSAAQYNGNIGGMLWKSTGDDQLRKYDFTYDAVNRLTGADFNQLTNNTFSKSSGINFSATGFNYDANGNIVNMNQKGWKVGGSETIDSLLYTYLPNTNKLLNVLDRKNDTATKLGDFRTSKAYMTSLSNNKTISATDYTYDANGSLSLDKNKDISNIHYNHLNLPDSITITGKGSIKYIYDAAGNKLKKITTEGIKVKKITTTLYLIGNFINDTLQFLPQEEGRVRFKVADASLQYDYFLKDHLGNVRMVLTEEQQTDAYPVASLETMPLTNERKFYNGVDTGRVNKNSVPGYPADTYTNPNDYIQKLNGSGFKIGTGIVLKVMAGDKFNLRVNSWWNSANTPGAPVNPLSNLLSGLISGVGSVAGSHGSVSELSSSGILSPGVTNFLTSHSGYTTSRPKAFVNWILFDEQFRFVSSSSGFEQVSASNIFTTHLKNNLPVNKSGYLYIYLSNETPNIDVFFDNFQVTQIRGPLLEETHYYPFGLTMAGISSKAMGSLINREKFNDATELQSSEFSDGSGLELYATQFRSLDPQLGRFWQLDPIDGLSHNASLYSFASNNPVLRNDPSGLKDSIMNGEHVDFKALPDISYTPPKKIQPFSWPAIRADQGKWSDAMFVRQRDEKPLVQGNEPPWILNNLDFYKKVYQNDIDYRTNQLVVVIILMSPLLLEAAPELLAAIQEQAKIIEAATKVVGTDIYGYSNLLLNKGITSALQAIIRTLPVSMGSLSKILASLADKPVDIITGKSIYQIIKSVLSHSGYKGLPGPNNFFFKVK